MSEAARRVIAVHDAEQEFDAWRASPLMRLFSPRDGAACFHFVYDAYELEEIARRRLEQNLKDVTESYECEIRRLKGEVELLETLRKNNIRLAQENRESRDLASRAVARAKEAEEREGKLTEQVARLIAENADPVAAAHQEMMGTLQMVVAAAGGRIELGPEHRLQCDRSLLAAIPTLSCGVILVNVPKPAEA